jgi:hypothetical protein
MPLWRSFKLEASLDHGNERVRVRDGPLMHYRRKGADIPSVDH